MRLTSVARESHQLLQPRDGIVINRLVLLGRHLSVDHSADPVESPPAAGFSGGQAGVLPASALLGDAWLMFLSDPPAGRGGARRGPGRGQLRPATCGHPIGLAARRTGGSWS